MSDVRVRPCGTGASLLELPLGQPPAAVAGRLRELYGGRLTEVVPGHRTVLVVGPLSVDELRAAAESGLSDDIPLATASSHAIHVRYDGPDLDSVAQTARLSREEVVRRHVACSYTVAFLGFAPGFGYLIGGDPRLHVPRRDRPRERVPAGSVAIAGPYSGIYPRDSPGGWSLLGRTGVLLFDPDRTPPALLAAGDEVRFLPLP